MNQILLAISLLLPVWLFFKTKVTDDGQPPSWSAIRWGLVFLAAESLVFLFVRWLCGLQGAAVFLIPAAITAKHLFVEISKPKMQDIGAPRQTAVL